MLKLLKNSEKFLIEFLESKIRFSLLRGGQMEAAAEVGGSLENTE